LKVLAVLIIDKNEWYFLLSSLLKFFFKKNFVFNILKMNEIIKNNKQSFYIVIILIIFLIISYYFKSQKSYLEDYDYDYMKYYLLYRNNGTFLKQKEIKLNEEIKFMEQNINGKREMIYTDINTPLNIYIEIIAKKEKKGEIIKISHYQPILLKNNLNDLLNLVVKNNFIINDHKNQIQYFVRVLGKNEYKKVVLDYQNQLQKSTELYNCEDSHNYLDKKMQRYYCLSELQNDLQNDL
jgi:hypothetical protein